MPVNGLVEFHHTCLGCRVFNEPAVEWIVKNGLVGTPAVWIVVRVFLNVEGFARHFHLHTHHDVEVFRLLGSLLVPYAVRVEAWVVGVLHVVACVFAVSVFVYAGSNEVVVEFLKGVILTL